MKFFLSRLWMLLLVSLEMFFCLQYRQRGRSTVYEAYEVAVDILQRILIRSRCNACFLFAIRVSD